MAMALALAMAMAMVGKWWKDDNNNEKGKHTMENIIGKKVIVRANVAGVHAGIVDSVDTKTSTIRLTNAYRLWRIYTRDSSGSISDVAANGLKPKGNHSIGACLAGVTIINASGLEIAEMTDDAYKSIQDWKN